MATSRTLLFCALFPIVSVGHATNYYVKTTGSDAANGTSIASAFKTIQHALNVAAPGTIIYVKAGTYKERLTWSVSGTALAAITLTNYSGGIVYLNGGAGGSNSAQNAMILVNDKSHIRIKNLRILNNYRNFAEGIHIDGSGDDISVMNCSIFNIGWTTNAATVPTISQNANPLVVLGTGANAIDGVTISGNKVYNCVTGYSEGVSINGNVTNFSVLNNQVHGITNIGIVCAGHYTWTGAPAEVNQARNGVVRGNIVYNCVSLVATSAGIYVDGGKSIIVERNTSYANGAGFSVGCENANATTTDVHVRDNIAYSNLQVGAFFGSNNATSVVRKCSLTNNSFFRDYKVGGYGAEVSLANDDSCTVTNNIFVARTDSCVAVGLFGYTATALAFHHNLFWRSTGNTGFILANVTSGAGDVFADPLFTSNYTPTLDMSLQTGSPAINAGDPAFVAAMGEMDLDGSMRVQGTAVDMGAYESMPGPMAPDRRNAIIPEATSLLRIFPDPATGEIVWIDMSASDSQEISIFNSSGQCVRAQRVGATGNTRSIDLAELNNGLYVVRAQRVNGEVLSGRFSVAR